MNEKENHFIKQTAYDYCMDYDFVETIYNRLKKDAPDSFYSDFYNELEAELKRNKSISC
jgi:hypothetical protein